MAGFVPLRSAPAWTPFGARPEGAPAEDRPPPRSPPPRSPQRPAAPPPTRAAAAPLTPVPAPAEPDRALAAARTRAEQAAEERVARDHAERERAAEHTRRLAELERLQEIERAGLAAEHVRLAAEVTRLGEIAAGLEALRSALIADLRTQAAELVVSAATRIAGDGLRTQPALLDALLDEAIGALGPAELVVRISPEDEARVRPALEARAIRVIADDTIRGGCLAYSPAGRIDATLDTAVEALRASAGPWARS